MLWATNWDYSRLSSWKRTLDTDNWLSVFNESSSWKCPGRAWTKRWNAQMRRGWNLDTQKMWTTATGYLRLREAKSNGICKCKYQWRLMHEGLLHSSLLQMFVCMLSNTKLRPKISYPAMNIVGCNCILCRRYWYSVWKSYVETVILSGSNATYYLLFCGKKTVSID